MYLKCQKCLKKWRPRVDIPVRCAKCGCYNWASYNRVAETPEEIEEITKMDDNNKLEWDEFN